MRSPGLVHESFLEISWFLNSTSVLIAQAMALPWRQKDLQKFYITLSSSTPQITKTWSLSSFLNSKSGHNNITLEISTSDRRFQISQHSSGLQDIQNAKKPELHRSLISTSGKKNDTRPYTSFTCPNPCTPLDAQCNRPSLMYPGSPWSFFFNF